MAYIRKLKDKWQAQIERNGQRTSKTFETKREAQQWALEQDRSGGQDTHWPHCRAPGAACAVHGGCQ